MVQAGIPMLRSSPLLPQLPAGLEYGSSPGKVGAVGAVGGCGTLRHAWRAWNGRAAAIDHHQRALNDDACGTDGNKTAGPGEAHVHTSFDDDIHASFDVDFLAGIDDVEHAGFVELVLPNLKRVVHADLFIQVLSNVDA